jgi:uncharacterized Zn-finger protein
MTSAMVSLPHQVTFLSVYCGKAAAALTHPLVYMDAG